MTEEKIQRKDCIEGKVCVEFCFYINDFEYTEGELEESVTQLIIDKLGCGETLNLSEVDVTYFRSYGGHY